MSSLRQLLQIIYNKWFVISSVLVVYAKYCHFVVWLGNTVTRLPENLGRKSDKVVNTLAATN